MRAFVVVMLVGCLDEALPPATPSPDPTVRQAHPATSVDCQAMVPMLKKMLASASSAVQAQLPAILDSIIASCTDDRWSKELIQCFGAATDEVSINECTRRFSKEQAEGLQRRLMTVMTMDSQNPPPAP